MAMIGGILLFIAVLAFAIAQLAIGYMGLQDWLGSWAGMAGVVVALLFRFTLPLTIGVFFGARDVMGWHWTLALLFAAPGLAFMVPSVIGGLLSMVRRSN